MEGLTRVFRALPPRRWKRGGERKAGASVPQEKELVIHPTGQGFGDQPVSQNVEVKIRFPVKGLGMPLAYPGTERDKGGTGSP